MISVRKIIHIDMDAFFASVEMRDNPALRNVPMAVGGSSDRRGVISTSNYEARKYGVKSAMPTSHAFKLCPHLVLVKGRMEKYKEAAEQVLEIFYQYTDLVQSMGWDEAYLDVTDSPLHHNSATWIAQEIRQKIFEKTGLTASAGIAPNKLLSKMAGEIKKPNGQFTVSPDLIESFMLPLPINKIPGIGKVTSGRLHEMGYKTCGDLQKNSRSEMIHLFGKFGDTLFDYCRGEDDRELELEYERKSLGNENTFAQDIYSLDEMKEQLKGMISELIEDLAKYPEKKVKNLHVKIKYHDFKQTTIERALPVTEEFFMLLLEERWMQDPRPVRLLGVGVKFEEQKNPQNPLLQLPLLGYTESHE